MNLQFSVNQSVAAVIADLIRRRKPCAGDDPFSVIRESSEDEVFGAMAEHFGIPFLPSVSEFASHGFVRRFNHRTMARGFFVPFAHDEESNVVYVAVANPFATDAQDTILSVIPEAEMVRVLVPAQAVVHLLEQATGGGGPTADELAGVEVGSAESEVQDLDVTNPPADSPVVALICTIIANAIKSKASDIHINSEKDRTYYTYRIHGDLQEPMDHGGHLHRIRDNLDAALLNYINVGPEQRNVLPAIDGRFSVSHLGRGIDVRYARLRTSRGFAVTLRLLDHQMGMARIGEGTLAFDPKTLFALRQVMAQPSGLIVISGPTGSGKSTTLNAILREIYTPEINIMTLENPVEDEIPGVVHCNLRDEDEFKRVMAGALRSDPDVIKIGEVRDLESARLATAAAMTGHKVLTTIHTNTAAQILDRFEEIGVDRTIICQTMKACCAQRLVKVLCQECRIEKRGISGDISAIFGIDQADWADQVWYERNIAGCHACQKGVSGRTAVMEIIPLTARMADRLAKREVSSYDLAAYCQREMGLPSLRESGLELVRRGLSDFRTVAASGIDLTPDESEQRGGA